jgi:hypothetical protein
MELGSIYKKGNKPRQQFKMVGLALKLDREIEGKLSWTITQKTRQNYAYVLISNPHWSSKNDKEIRQVKKVLLSLNSIIATKHAIII